MANQTTSPGPSNTQEPLPWPYSGLSRLQALERRNYIVRWVFAVAGVLTLAWLVVIGWVSSLPTDTFEQLLVVRRLQDQVSCAGVLIMGLWAVPILIARYTADLTER
jgi:hypothetical protein